MKCKLQKWWRENYSKVLDIRESVWHCRHFIYIRYCAVQSYRSPFYQAAYVHELFLSWKRKRERDTGDFLCHQLACGKYKSSDDCAERENPIGRKNRKVAWFCGGEKRRMMFFTPGDRALCRILHRPSGK